MKPVAKSLAADVLAVAGAVCLSAGAWWIYHPAGILVAGAFLLFAAGRVESEACSDDTPPPQGER